MCTSAGTVVKYYVEVANQLEGFSSVRLKLFPTAHVLIRQLVRCYCVLLEQKSLCYRHYAGDMSVE